MELVTEAKERPIFKSLIRNVAPRLEPCRKRNEETVAGASGSLAVTPGSLSEAGLSHMVEVAVSMLYRVTIV